MKATIHNLLSLFLPVIFAVIILPGIGFTKTFQVITEQGFLAALNEAETNQDHDLILLEQKTYTGSFVYSSAEAFNLTIQGGYSSNFSTRATVPAETTFLDGNHEHPVLVLVCTAKADFTVDGITIRNGQTVTNSSGGGLYIDTNEGSFILTNSIIHDNTAQSFGGGIYIKSRCSEVTLTGNTIDMNTATSRGGGIYCDGVKIISLSDNQIEYNAANTSGGGGIYFLNSSIINVTGNSISHNDSGGGIIIYRMSNGTARIHNNRICNNSNGSGVGIDVYSSYRINNVFLTNNVICDNYNATLNKGAGVYLEDVSQATLTNNTIVNNTAIAEGGGVWSDSSLDDNQLNLYNNIIWNNGGVTGRDLYINSDGNNNYIFSEVNLYNNNFDQTNDTGFFISDPGFYVDIDPSNLNNVNPQFVDSTAFNYHLKAISPFNGKGDNNAPELPSMDMDGESRIMDRVVEIGADEITSEKVIKTMPWIPLLLLD